MRCPTIVLALATVLLTACAQDERPTGAPSAELQPAFYDSIRQRVPDYFAEINNKVLAACIDWSRSTPYRAEVPIIYWVYTGLGSDGSVSRGELRQSALLDCDNTRAERGLDCECDIAAHGNAITVDPSSEQLALMGTARRVARKKKEPKGPPTKIELFTGTASWEGAGEKLEAGFMLVRRGDRGDLNLTLDGDVCRGSFGPIKTKPNEFGWAVYCRTSGRISGNGHTGKDGALSAVGKTNEGRVISFEMRSEL